MSNPRRTPEAAEFLGVSESFLNKDRSNGGAGRVAFRRAGRAVVYDEVDLEAFKRANRVEAKIKPPQRAGTKAAGVRHASPDTATP
jgi:hypothetical protein